MSVSKSSAVGGLILAFYFAQPRLEPLVNLTLGLPTVSFLPAPAIATLLVGGAVLGGVGGLVAKGRP